MPVVANMEHRAKKSSLTKTVTARMNAYLECCHETRVDDAPCYRHLDNEHKSMPSDCPRRSVVKQIVTHVMILTPMLWIEVMSDGSSGVSAVRFGQKSSQMRARAFILIAALAKVSFMMYFPGFIDTKYALFIVPFSLLFAWPRRGG